MDSTLFNSLYATAVCDFTDASSMVARQEIYGTWPINYKTTRLMLLYIFALAQVAAGTVTLTDNQIMNIVSRMNKLKYQQ